MLYDFLTLSREDGVPLCRQLYEKLRAGIEAGYLRPGDKLASIRQAAAELQLSRTTVENAYLRLCLEGYAEAKPQSGYRVRAAPARMVCDKMRPYLRPSYDFGTSCIDEKAADLQNWKRLMRAVLSDAEAVSSYGDPQGEATLRQALAFYAFGARGVSAEPDMIFIGAGVGPLLQLLCPLFPHKPAVFMERPGFVQAEQIFRDYGFPVETACRGGGLPALPLGPAAFAVELPSLRPKCAPALLAARRTALSQWARAAQDRYVIEDDYNGELRYRTRPVPAFQGSCPDKTIYLGSFSKLLLPSVRVAYMVLPLPLAQKARTRLSTLNQTAGKTEQLALAEYIRCGLLEKHLRRMRRLYTQKSQRAGRSLKNVFGGAVSYALHETSLSFSLSVNAACGSDKLEALAYEKGIICRAAPQTSDAQPHMTLGFSGIPLADIESGIAALHTAWRGVLR